MTIVMFTYSETVIFSYFHFNCFLEWELEWFLMYLNQITEFCLTWRTLSFFSSNVSKLGMKNWFLISVPISTSVIFSLIDFYMGGGWHSHRPTFWAPSPFLLLFFFFLQKYHPTIFSISIPIDMNLFFWESILNNWYHPTISSFHSNAYTGGSNTTYRIQISVHFNITILHQWQMPR